MHLSMDISTNDPTIESYGLSNGGVERNVLQRSTWRFQNEIIVSVQTLPNVSAFRDILYLMSLQENVLLPTKILG